MNRLQTYTSIFAALFLGGIFTFPPMSRSIHILFFHKHHYQQQTSDNETIQEYTSCLYSDMYYTHFEAVQNETLCSPSLVSFIELFINYTNPIISNKFSHILLRGPPYKAIL